MVGKCLRRIILAGKGRVAKRNIIDRNKSLSHPLKWLSHSS